MQQQQPPPNNARKKPANPLTAAAAVAFLCAAATLGAAAPEAPRAPAVLPVNSPIVFVLDQTIGSKSTAGDSARAHLRDAIVVGGLTVAPAGTPVTIKVLQAQRAQLANVDGSVDIYFEPLKLPSGVTVPLSTPTSHIDPHLTAGRSSTRTITDTVGDIFIPGHYLYHILRKGMDVTLHPGTQIRARTAATVEVSGGTVAVVTPPPFPAPVDSPHSAFVPAPFATAPGFKTPTPKPSPSPTAGAAPTLQPTTRASARPHLDGH